jgi:hypothetical protein
MRTLKFIPQLSINAIRIIASPKFAVVMEGNRNPAFERICDTGSDQSAAFFNIPTRDPEGASGKTIKVRCMRGEQKRSQAAPLLLFDDGI